MRAIIVEDQGEVLEELQLLISEYSPTVELIGSAGSVVSAARLLKEQKPELLFLDIELPDGSGFDLLDIVDYPVKTIFITGSDGFAIRAFRYAAVDYLLKPVDPEELNEAIMRAQKEEPLDSDQIDSLKSSLESGAMPHRIALHTSDKIHFVEVSDIIRCMADGNYTRFYLKHGTSLLVARTLKDYDKLLSDADFIRVHQSHLVNLRSVREYVKVDGGYLIMSDGAKVPVSTRKKTEVLERFNQLPHA